VAHYMVSYDLGQTVIVFCQTHGLFLARFIEYDKN